MEAEADLAAAEEEDSEEVRLALPTPTHNTVLAHTDLFPLSGRGGFAPQGPPASVLELGSFMHATEGEMVCTSSNPKIPYFNAPVFLENKTPIGKVDEILGPLNQVYFTIKPTEGIVATSFKAGDKFFIGGDKLLPLERYVPLSALYSDAGDRYRGKFLPETFADTLCTGSCQSQRPRQVQPE